MVVIIGFTLLLADRDHSNRHNLFSQLKIMICDENRHMSDMIKLISFARRQFPDLDVQKVISFLDFCLRSLNECATSHEGNEIKMHLSTFKNSLTITKCFSALQSTLAFQPVP